MPPTPVAQMLMHIDLDVYSALSREDCKAFDAWLAAAGLTDKRIVSMTFDGLTLTATCIADPIRLDASDQVVTETKTFTVSTPPPIA